MSSAGPILVARPVDTAFTSLPSTLFRRTYAPVPAAPSSSQMRGGLDRSLHGDSAFCGAGMRADLPGSHLSLGTQCRDRGCRVVGTVHRGARDKDIRTRFGAALNGPG